MGTFKYSGEHSAFKLVSPRKTTTGKATNFPAASHDIATNTDAPNAVAAPAALAESGVDVERANSSALAPDQVEVLTGYHAAAVEGTGCAAGSSASDLHQAAATGENPTIIAGIDASRLHPLLRASAFDRASDDEPAHNVGSAATAGPEAAALAINPHATDTGVATEANGDISGSNSTTASEPTVLSGNVGCSFCFWI